MSAPAGYLIKHVDGLRGTRGVAYDFVLAGNGLWVETPQHRLIFARVQAHEFNVPGLAPMDGGLQLTHGKIPAALWDCALQKLVDHAGAEWFVSIYWNDEHQEYAVQTVAQTVTRASVEYDPQAMHRDTVFEMHSHNDMGAFFSATDDRDEQGLRVYGVAGHIADPVFRLRVGAYGRFMPVLWSDVFSGTLRYGREADDSAAVRQARWPRQGLIARQVLMARLMSKALMAGAAYLEDWNGDTDAGDPEEDLAGRAEGDPVQGEGG